MTTCVKRANWFCVLCASYVYIKHRIRFNEAIKGRYQRAYGELPDNLGNVFVPSIICRTCHNDLQRYLNQSKPLRYKQPAVWNRPADDHSDCFMCCFTVHKYNRIAKRLFGYATNTSLVLPIANEIYNDKLNNLQNIKKGKPEFRTAREEATIKVLVNDMITSIETGREYLFKESKAVVKRPVFRPDFGLSISRSDYEVINGLDVNCKINFLNRLNLVGRATTHLRESRIVNQLNGKLNPHVYQHDHTYQRSNQPNSQPNNQSNHLSKLNRQRCKQPVRQLSNPDDKQFKNLSNPNVHLTSPNPKQQTDQRIIVNQQPPNQHKRSASYSSEDDEISIVGVIKRKKHPIEVVSTGNSKIQANFMPTSTPVNNIAQNVKTINVPKSILNPKLIHNNNVQPTIRPRIRESTRRDHEIVHDIEFQNGQISQVKSRGALNGQPDLSSGVFQGSFRVEQGIELRTYFGKKFKQNRQVQKTSRNEFDDLVSMMEIDEKSTSILETFFERKNYFVWF